MNANRLTAAGRCTWRVTASHLGGDGLVSVFTLPPQTKDIFELGNLDKSPIVPGLGDDAYYSTTFDAMNVLKGGNVVAIQGTFSGADPAAIRSDVEKLTAIVLHHF